MKMLKEFWSFVIEREMIRLRRRAGLPRPWSEDYVMQTYSFTNVKRAHDRITTLLREEFYDRRRLPGSALDWSVNSVEEVEAVLKMYLINAAHFRYTCTMESARLVGWLPEWDAEQKARFRRFGVMDELRFTSAYLIPNCGDSRAKYEVVADILDGIWDVAGRVVAQSSWETAIGILSDCWGCGSFMAKEVYLDFLEARGDWRPDDWQTWTPVGPGGQRGAMWVLSGHQPGRGGKQEKLPESEALDVIRAIYATCEENWPTHMRLPWSHASPNCDNHCGCDDDSVIASVALDLTDVQFQLCEFDKYNRAKNGGRPKRLFRPTIDGVTRG